MPMHIVILSVVVAIVVCVLLLAGLGLFARTPHGREIEERERRDGHTAVG
jgi:hypothetical protein